MTARPSAGPTGAPSGATAGVRWSKRERDEALRRLAVRGDLTVKLHMDPKATRRYADGHSTVTEYASVPTPKWSVHVGYRYGNVFAAVLRWDDVYVEHEDLDEALRLALVQSEPRRVWLYERVWEHEDFKRAAELAEAFRPEAAHV